MTDSTGPTNQPDPTKLYGPLAENSVTLPASREEVWDLLTTPEGICRWYTVGGGAEIEATVGGRIALWWENDTKFVGRVVHVEHPRRFDYRLAQAPNTSPQIAESTLVQFLLTEAEQEGHTVLAVRESGFDKITNPKDAFTASAMAWIGAFGLMQQVLGIVESD